MRAMMRVTPFQRPVLRCFRPVLSTGLIVSEHKGSRNALCTAMGFIAASTFLVKPVILRRLGPVNDGSDVHLFPGHSN
jgi:hypothetical protein